MCRPPVSPKMTTALPKKKPIPQPISRASAGSAVRPLRALGSGERTQTLPSVAWLAGVLALAVVGCHPREEVKPDTVTAPTTVVAPVTAPAIELVTEPVSAPVSAPVIEKVPSTLAGEPSLVEVPPTPDPVKTPPKYVKPKPPAVIPPHSNNMQIKGGLGVVRTPVLPTRVV